MTAFARFLFRYFVFSKEIRKVPIHDLHHFDVLMLLCNRLVIKLASIHTE
jgi:hypothetical protein